MLFRHLGITLKFDAAHFLPGYDGPCSRMHGHTWRVDYRIGYINIDGCGIAVDFKVLKKALAQTLPDHELVNELVTPPSAEMMVRYLWERAEAALSAISRELHRHDLELESVRLWESEAAYAELTAS